MKKLLLLPLILVGAMLLSASCEQKPEETTTTRPETSVFTQPETTTEGTTLEETTTAEPDSETMEYTTTRPSTTMIIKTTGEPMTNDDTPRREEASPAEIRAEERRVQGLVSSLDADKIDKIVLVQTQPTGAGAQRFTYESASQDAITAWVDVFDAMELSGAQFEFLSGGNLAVYAYAGNKEIELGCLEGNYLTNGKLRTMCRIDNYGALYEDIKNAAAMVSGDLVV